MCGALVVCGVVYVRICTVGVVGLGCGLKPLKSAAGTAVVGVTAVGEAEGRVCKD